MKTIYQVAREAMDGQITRYLELLEATNGFEQIKKEHLEDPEIVILFSAGLGHRLDLNQKDYSSFLIREYHRKAAVPFDVEDAVSIGVYNKIRPYAELLYEKAEKLTKGFTLFEAEGLQANPCLLPVFQNMLGFSKAQLKKKIGSVSDSSISCPASERFATILSDSIHIESIVKSNILQRIEITLEGIVRDLVGRVLFEEVVAHSLDKYEVEYLREEEYSSLIGVVYDFRSDFVIPNSINPVAFIEVRKSSSRHASLYAKDKMFSAINWKGKYKNLIGIIVVEGDWTQSTLQIMSKVFDYVIPLNKTPLLAKLLRKALDGDKSILRWLIDFKINPSKGFSDKNLV